MEYDELVCLRMCEMKYSKSGEGIKLYHSEKILLLLSEMRQFLKSMNRILRRSQLYEILLMTFGSISCFTERNRI